MSIAPQPSITIPPLHQWIAATWAEYVVLRDAPIEERMRLFFDRGRMWLDMGGEGINHSQVSDLLTMLFGFWAVQHPEQMYNSFGRCLLEKPETQACAPDLVLYIGEDYPRWREGEPRRIDLSRWRVPNLVGEIGDTTLATDLDEKKHLYEALEIPEYWAIDVRGRRIFAFELQLGKYEICTTSQALSGLPIALLEQAIDRLAEETNTSAAAWFAQQLQSLK
ncbi:Uma2 family endonuclease [Microcoleus sp. FACHB-1515]|uniref:Uma2 family endonuclease n=1 Tax=Cyanophyceae TaxID=3028117 RepID=UPI00168778D6|nr:Uma2 family endonuclease [Microcoleus sp. FACHB-1515]MBD2089542.1 Uma2 family endonuclease [Microcoleus sp. FACHB-1515]